MGPWPAAASPRRRRRHRLAVESARRQRPHRDPLPSVRPDAARSERPAHRRRLAAGIAAGDDALLHRARKAAKRARYAAELVEPLNKGKRVRNTIKHHEEIQTVLGELQDTVVARNTLLRLATKAGTTPGENGFTYGLLYANELRRGEAARRAARELA